MRIIHRQLRSRNTWFVYFADKEGITDSELTEAVNRLEAGKADADLEKIFIKVL